MRTVINNGFVVDPKNKIFDKYNIAVENGKIKEISKEKLFGDKEIDVNGLIVCPGFIDLHMHEDFVKDGEIHIDIFDRMLKMGVTTAIGGNCGIGPDNPVEYLNLIDKGNPINFGMFLPHSILRNKIGVFDRYSSLNNKQVEEMFKIGKKIVKEAKLFGISFGIRYVPGMDFNELITLAKLGEHRITSAHLRDDAGNIFKALDEFLQIADYVKTHLQVSHIGSMAGFGQMKEFLKMVEEKRKNGIDIACDCYPYTAFSTKIGEATFDDGFIERYNIDYEALEFAEGKYKGKRCTKETFDEVRKNNPETLMIAHVMNEDDIKEAFVYPYTVLASDGILSENGDGHPRATGAFTRFIRKYVKEDKILDLYSAINKMTNMPAKILGIDKGHLSQGADADITIFNFEEIEDMATFENSRLDSKGIEYVLISGEVAFEKNEIKNRKLGKSVRKII